MENCSEKKECGGRREFLVKAGAIAGGVMLTLTGAASVAKAADDDIVVKVDVKGDLITKGAQTFETTAGKIIVIHGDAGFTAFEAKCTHKGGPLNYDTASKTLSCPLHGSKFDAATGAVAKGPASSPLIAHSAEAAIHIGAKPKA